MKSDALVPVQVHQLNEQSQYTHSIFSVTDSLTEHPSTSSPQKSSEEQLELLKKKYFLQ